MMNKEMKMEIEDLINSVADQDFAQAAPTFAEIMRSKMDDALEQEKVAVAGQVFNGEVDPDQEDIDDAIDELEDDEQLEMDFDEEDDEE